MEMVSKTLDIRYLFNINKPSEWDSNYDPGISLHTLGDDVRLAIDIEGVEDTFWAPSSQDIHTSRNSLVKFEGLKVPCFSKVFL